MTHKRVRLEVPLPGLHYNVCSSHISGESSLFFTLSYFTPCILAVELCIAFPLPTCLITSAGSLVCSLILRTVRLSFDVMGTVYSFSVLIAWFTLYWLHCRKSS